MLKRVLTVAMIVMLATTVWLQWSRTNQASLPPLVIRRVTPAEGVLRGTPQLPVKVELELTNTTDKPIELAPLKMNCSCQLTKGPDPVIPAHGTTTVSLSLRYPAATSTVIPVPFYSPSGVELARTEIVLETSQSPPYFTNLPDIIDIQLIQGLSDGTWSASAHAIELAEQEPHVSGYDITSGNQWLSVTKEMTEDGPPGAMELERTYQMKFQLQQQAWTDLQSRDTLQGTVMLQLHDGTKHPIPWRVTTKPPIALFYDSNTQKIRGIRRGGAKGKVTLRCIPEGSGKLTATQFESEQKIEATVDITKPLTAIKAEYEGHNGIVHVSLEIP